MRSKIVIGAAAICAAGLVLAGCNQQETAQAPAEPAQVPAEQQATQLDMSPQGNANFLATNAAMEGVTTTASGLQYRVITPGTGTMPNVADDVTVTYRGWLIDGTVFDQTDPGQTATFPTGQLIPGWVEALQLMQEGAEWEIVVPSELGYGASGAGGVIPPNQTLVFNMSLIMVGG